MILEITVTGKGESVITVGRFFGQSYRFPPPVYEKKGDILIYIPYTIYILEKRKLWNFFLTKPLYQ